MLNIILCDNFFTCFESILIFLIFCLSLIFYLNGFISISKSLVISFDNLDKFIYFLCIIQISLYILYQVIFPRKNIIYSLRALRLLQEIFICVIFSYIYFDEFRIKNIQRFKAFAVFYTFILWISKMFSKNSSCFYFNLFIFSSSTLIFNCIEVVLGILSLLIIKEFEEKSKKEENNDLNLSLRTFSDNLNFSEITKKEMESRKVQIFILMLTHFLSCFSQILIDYSLYLNSSEIPNCNNYKFKLNSFFGFLFFSFLHFLSIFFPYWGIYYVFYWRNRELFNSNNDKINNTTLEY